MKIWILTTEYPPAFGGGIGTYVENVSKMYSDKGENVKVILRDKVNSREYENSNLEVCRFTIKQDGKYKYMGDIQSMAFQYFEYINQLLKEDTPDIIEIQEFIGIGYYILQNKYLNKDYLKNIPVVVHLHTPQFALFDINKEINYKLPNYWIGEMEKFCIKAADGLLCPSHFLAEKLQYINPNVEIKVINLPFNLPEDNEKLEKDKDLFIYFGRTEYRKGVEHLLKAFENLWSQGEKCKLKLVGGDTLFFPKNMNLGELLKEKYKNRIEEGLLFFQDNTPQDQLIKEIKKATYAIIPSLYENFPNTCIMSMWLEKPVIVSKQGGQSEMVENDGVNGFIFDHNIEGDLEKTILKAYKKDTKQLQIMGTNAKKRIYDLCNMEKNYKLRKDFMTSTIENYKIKEKYPFINETSKYIKEKDNNSGLSVVIPYYNMGKYIDETINSINESTYKAKEIIIVNDGSNDDFSIESLKKYRNSKNIKIIDIKNKGLANARNVGADAATGEFIAFLDADDIVEKTFYKKGIDILNRFDNISYVFSWVKYFEGSKGIWTTFDVQLPYLLCHNMLNANTLIRRKDFIKYGKNRIEMEYGMEDYDMWISLAENNCFGVCIPELLSLYRVRKDSMARGFNTNNVLYLMEKITKNHKLIYEKYGPELFNILISNGPSYYYNNPSKYIRFEMNTNLTLKDKLWNHKLYRGFIKFLQKLGIMQFLKKHFKKEEEI